MQLKALFYSPPPLAQGSPPPYPFRNKDGKFTNSFKLYPQHKDALLLKILSRTFFLFSRVNPVPKRGLSYLSGGGGTFWAKSRTKPFLLLSFVSPLLPPLPGWTENANRIDRKEEREEGKFDKSFSSPSLQSAGGKNEILNFLMRSHLSQILKGKGNTFPMNGW